MKFLPLFISLSSMVPAILGLPAVSQSVPSPTERFLEKYGLPGNQLGATVFSLLYGAPLSGFATEASSSGLLENFGTNKLHTIGTLASPASSRFVVKTNVDTIYAPVIFDLSSVDLVINVPPFGPERFYLFAFFDT
jgi:hypothetical protein